MSAATELAVWSTVPMIENQDLMCGFAVHWPNNSQSVYRRTEAGAEMVNCMVNSKQATVDLWVDLYARKPGTFSPLVEEGARAGLYPARQV